MLGKLFLPAGCALLLGLTFEVPSSAASAALAASVSRTPWISLFGSQDGCIKLSPPFSPNPCAVTEIREHVVQVFTDGHAILLDTLQANAGPPVARIVEGKLTPEALRLVSQQAALAQLGSETVACNPFRASDPLGDYQLDWYGRNGRRSSIPLQSLARVSCSKDLEDLYILLIGLGGSIVPEK